ncbi:putative amidohydrolase YtcJ [Bradyrhizobium sp. USDA 4463]
MQQPDFILFNGKIITVDRAFTIVEAVAVSGSKICAAGANHVVRELAGPRTREIDLRGRTAIPGLIDTHCHVEAAGLIGDTVSFSGVACVADALSRIEEMAARTPPGQWIRGQVWHPLSQLREKRYLTRWEIDSVAPEHPVYLPVGHFTMANSQAMRIAKVDRETLDPTGGEIDRDHTGEPTGLFAEAAERLIEDVVPPWSRDARVRQLELAMQYFNQFGITSAISGAVSPADVDAYDVLRKAGRTTLRVGMMFAPTGELNPSISVKEWGRRLEAVGDLAAFNDEWLSYEGAKLQVDGGMTLKTAAMRVPYPESGDYRGECVIDALRLGAFVSAANRLGWRIGIHAVGDAAIDLVLGAYERADQEESIEGRRFTIIHGSLIRPDQMRRARELGVRVDFQSPFLWTKASTIASLLGQANAESAIPARTMIGTMGLNTLGAGTDYPINPLDPFINMQIMVTRKDANGQAYGPSEQVTREEALRLYTSAAAHYSFSEKSKGSIEVGKLADITVLSSDLLTVPEAEIRNIQALATIVDGRFVHGEDMIC